VAEHRLKPRLSLSGAAPRVDLFDGLSITENGDRALASLAGRRGRADDLDRACKDLFGVALPGPGRAASGQTYTVTWTGPEQWFVEAPFATHEDIARILKDKLRDAASVTEQTDGWVRFDVIGPRACDVFERLCALNVRRMQTGDTSRTLIEHLGCLVICRKQSLEFSVLGLRSAADSLHHAMVTAAKGTI
jgi:sarcosine oxidase, subunit gamma